MTDQKNRGIIAQSSDA